jgi:DNA-binding NarL/FixJ family response regulator
MPKDINVLLIEDDIYARNLMTLFLTRDWRTRVIGEAGSESDVKRILEEPFQKVHAIVLDTEVPMDPEWPFRVAKIAQKHRDPPVILCTATKPAPGALKEIIKGHFGGYVLKKEVGYALASAVAEATKRHKWIVTPGVYKLALRLRIHLPENTIILDGTKPVTNLTPRESEIARLAILFNHAHRDLADELLIRADQVSKHVSNVYSKLGLDQIIAGEMSPELFIQDKLVLQHFHRILDRVSSPNAKRKTTDMATLAFHLLTIPEIRETT